MKTEWKKTEKNLYMPGTIPVSVMVPPMKYFCISGKGNPNEQPFQDKISILYSLSYAVRMMPKSGLTPLGYQEYTVYPLEGIWDLTEQGRKMQTLEKDQLAYKIMIRQPDFVTDEIFGMALDKTRKKLDGPLLDEVTFETMEDGQCVQMMHIGPFDSEPESFRRMDQYMKEQSLVRTTKTHKEIYLSDFRKTKPEELKTTLRYFVKPCELEMQPERECL